MDSNGRCRIEEVTICSWLVRGNLLVARRKSGVARSDLPKQLNQLGKQRVFAHGYCACKPENLSHQRLKPCALDKSH
jgi:hypothetical protein